jgi:hypothetical protein
VRTEHRRRLGLFIAEVSAALALWIVAAVEGIIHRTSALTLIALLAAYCVLGILRCASERQFDTFFVLATVFFCVGLVGAFALGALSESFCHCRDSDPSSKWLLALASPLAIASAGGIATRRLTQTGPFP